ncbi:MAG: DUF1294 domain-containing protein [Euryarchaeota archaeon]|nr:DUF1294 domain-containing protein [Euryarchaeota archaeon]
MIFYILIAYALINTIVFILYGIDKYRSRLTRRRIKDRVLLISAILGPFGAVAAMRLFHHKTKRAKFIMVPIFTILHIAVALLLIKNIIT